MSKERLEEIENKLIGWRTEELESTIVDFWSKDIRDVEWLIEQNKRYREAIEFGIKYLKNSDIRQVQLVVTALKSALDSEE